MLLIQEKFRPFAQVLLSSGTCPRCVLRFCCVGYSAHYRLPYKDLTFELEKHLAPCRVDTAEVTEVPPCKKVKKEDGTDHVPPSEDINTTVPRTCNLCLGMLQQYCETEFIKKVTQNISVKLSAPISKRPCLVIK
ncbi:hypothetical protein GDO86_000687 [Hymenochirus boettgeri]|uniref:Uncharacterized protein n=1 Tax=Hymenochirus boettgeri TaxID=247094 RepID=A0A8T2KFG3_9PIPI|nr:hypothetical protein GDO86_000687 [Hymenochirus boettgeri]